MFFGDNVKNHAKLYILHIFFHADFFFTQIFFTQIFFHAERAEIAEMFY